MPGVVGKDRKALDFKFLAVQRQAQALREWWQPTNAIHSSGSLGGYRHIVFLFLFVLCIQKTGDKCVVFLINLQSQLRAPGEALVFIEANQSIRATGEIVIELPVEVSINESGNRLQYGITVEVVRDIQNTDS